MPLQSSGQISLNQIHVEAGGTSQTEAAINDADIRGLIGASSEASNLGFNDFYGASSSASFVGSISRNHQDIQHIDSSSQAVDVVSAGVQVGDFVVIAICADLWGGNNGNITVSGMTMTVKTPYTYNADSGATSGFVQTNIPAYVLAYGFWQSGNSNPYFVNGTGTSSTSVLRALSLGAAIFRNTNSSVLNLIASKGSSENPNPASLSSVSGTKLIIAIAFLDDDEQTMGAPSGYTSVATAHTGSSTRDGVTGSCVAVAYKITSTSTTEDPSSFNSNTYSDSWKCYTLRV
mgnify:CR=1 FL=1